MKKKWWEYFNYVGGVAITLWMISDKFSVIGFALLGLAIVSTVIYFFNQQKHS
jgi:hypothetical protein